MLLGEIFISTSENNSFLTCNIKNTGSFIHQDNIKQIFDIGYSSSEKSSTGLGLVVAKQIIELHDGSIDCYSDKDAQEVKFIIRLQKQSII